MYRTAHQTAIGIAFILKRSGQSRARLSEKTIRRVSRRKRLRGAFVLDVTTSLADFGWSLCELGSGGYGVIQTKSLEAAKPVLASKFLDENERKALLRADFDFDEWESEAGIEDQDEETDDTD